MFSRYEKLQDKCHKLGESLTEVHHALAGFTGEAGELERWLGEANEALAEATTLARVDEIAKQRDARKDRLDSTLRDGRALVSKKVNTVVSASGTLQRRFNCVISTF